ncbi:alcohol dehydrogenase [Desmospora sp. 8437]|nr:alcohol dehydrogenase [Desmospora sp. 8437]
MGWTAGRAEGIRNSTHHYCGNRDRRNIATEPWSSRANGGIHINGNPTPPGVGDPTWNHQGDSFLR